MVRLVAHTEKQSLAVSTPCDDAYVLVVVRLVGNEGVCMYECYVCVSP